MAFEELFDDMRKMQKRFSGAFNLDRRVPESEIEEKDNEVVVQFELPGVDKKEINLELDEDKIAVRAVRKKEMKRENKEFYAEAKSFKGYQEVLSLPCRVIPDKARASFENGILEVRLPKAEPRKRKQVEIE